MFQCSVASLQVTHALGRGPVLTSSDVLSKIDLYFSSDEAIRRHCIGDTIVPSLDKQPQVVVQI